MCLFVFEICFFCLLVAYQLTKVKEHGIAETVPQLTIKRNWVSKNGQTDRQTDRQILYSHTDLLVHRLGICKSKLVLANNKVID